MYFCKNEIITALKQLSDVHPFFSITFLAYKEISLPIEKLVDTHGVERDFLEEYYRPTDEYDGYIRPSRVSDKTKMWVSSKYPDAGLQSIRTRNKIVISALMHDHGGGYGWKKDYVTKLRKLLKNEFRLPAFYMAIWLFRKHNWSSLATAQDVITKFKLQFKITEEEEELLFDMSIPAELNHKGLFCSEQLDWTGLKKSIGNYPRAPPDEGAFLKSLSLNGVGPAHNFEFEPGERLNIIAGDNGLGKTFLLDCAWWALTGSWAGRPVLPRLDARWSMPSIHCEVGSPDTSEEIESEYDWERAVWDTHRKGRILPGLLIYARIDNSFGIWDPAKFTLFESYWQSGEQLSLANYTAYIDPTDFQPGHLMLSEEEVWNGKEYRKKYGMDRVLCNGLIRDWMTWSADTENEAFGFLKSALRLLSPTGSKPLEPGKPVRIPTDARYIPTIRHPYGDVPIVDVSAGVRRILALAYLITWAWIEHKTVSAQIKKNHQTRIILLIDEIESHLHPQWQRTIIPALIDVIKILSPDLEIQFIIATHSPIVMASAEPSFDKELDKLFHLDLFGDKVELNEIPFVKYGKVDNWLQSDLFGLKHARSQEADGAIEKAKKLQLESHPDPKEVKTIDHELQKYLPGADEFWPRWIYFAKQHGVEP